MVKKAELEVVSLDLSRPQLRKLHKGQCCQLKPSQMSGGAVSIALTPAKVRKLKRAREKQRGLRLTLSQEELAKSGEGFKEVMSKLKSKIDASNANIKAGYKKHGKPIAKKVVTEAIKKGVPALISTFAPELAVPAGIVANAVADKAVEAIGKKTGAWGVRRRRLKEDSSTFQSPEHPAFSPALPQKDFSRPDLRMMRGKGFNVKTGATTSVSYGSGNLHPAQNPVLPMHDFSRPTTGGSFLPSGGYGFKPAGYGV